MSNMTSGASSLLDDRPLVAVSNPPLVPGAHPLPAVLNTGHQLNSDRYRDRDHVALLGMSVY